MLRFPNGRVMRIAGCLTGALAILMLPGCNPAGPGGTSHVISVSIRPSTDTLKVGETVQFDLSVVWSPGAHAPTVSPRWFLDNLDIASFGSWGAVTGESPGRVLLTGCIAEVCDRRWLTITG